MKKLLVLFILGLVVMPCVYGDSGSEESACESVLSVSCLLKGSQMLVGGIIYNKWVQRGVTALAAWYGSKYLYRGRYNDARIQELKGAIDQLGNRMIGEINTLGEMSRCISAAASQTGVDLPYSNSRLQEGREGLVASINQILRKEIPRRVSYWVQDWILAGDLEELRKIDENLKPIVSACEMCSG